MSYVIRKGVVFDPLVQLFSVIIIGATVYFGDWQSQYEGFTNQFSITYDLDPHYTVPIVLFLAGCTIAILWYILGKFLTPLFSSFLVLFFGGIFSRTFIDRNVNRRKMNVFGYIAFAIPSVLIVFSIDFFLASTFFFELNRIPSFRSMAVAVVIFSVVQPFSLVLDNIGLRAYNEGGAEVIGVSSFLNRFIFRLLSTGGLLGVFASISINDDILGQIPVTIQVIFLRSVVLTLSITMIYHMFFQPEANLERWRDRKLVSGVTTVKFDN